MEAVFTKFHSFFFTYLVLKQSKPMKTTQYYNIYLIRLRCSICAMRGNMHARTPSPLTHVPTQSHTYPSLTHPHPHTHARTRARTHTYALSHTDALSHTHAPPHAHTRPVEHTPRCTRACTEREREKGVEERGRERREREERDRGREEGGEGEGGDRR